MNHPTRSRVPPHLRSHSSPPTAPSSKRRHTTRSPHARWPTSSVPVKKKAVTCECMPMPTPHNTKLSPQSTSPDDVYTEPPRSSSHSPSTQSHPAPLRAARTRASRSVGVAPSRPIVPTARLPSFEPQAACHPLSTSPICPSQPLCTWSLRLATLRHNRTRDTWLPLLQQHIPARVAQWQGYPCVDLVAPAVVLHALARIIALVAALSAHSIYVLLDRRWPSLCPYSERACSSFPIHAPSRYLSCALRFMT